ncbi:MAG: hypothetical protein ACXV4B_04775 [Halobacteriota archaeon]
MSEVILPLLPSVDRHVVVVKVAQVVADGDELAGGDRRPLVGGGVQLRERSGEGDVSASEL